MGEGTAFNLEVFPKSTTAKVFILAHHLLKQGDEWDLSPSSVVDCSVARMTSVRFNLLCTEEVNGVCFECFSCHYWWRQLSLDSYLLSTFP